MKKQTSIVNTTRAVIIHDGKLLAFPTHSNPNLWCLPGGKIETGESITDAIIREIIEETGIIPKVGKLFAIHELINANGHRIEFFFYVENGRDFLAMDLTKASHGFEVKDYKFVDIKNDGIRIVPDISDAVTAFSEHGKDTVQFRIITCKE